MIKTFDSNGNVLKTYVCTTELAFAYEYIKKTIEELEKEKPNIYKLEKSKEYLYGVIKPFFSNGYVYKCDCGFVFDYKWERDDRIIICPDCLSELKGFPE